MISFVVPCKAVPFARAHSLGSQRFTPPRQRNFSDQVKLIARSAMAGASPLTGPVEVKIRAEYSAPKSWRASERLTTKWKSSRPDIDNIGKEILDSINQIVFNDDGQVASLIVQKAYSISDRIFVSIASLED